MPIDDQVYTPATIGAPRDTIERFRRKVHAVTADPADEMAMWKTSSLALEFRCKAVETFVRSHYGLVVQSGPFAGMRYIDSAAGSLFCPKILGSYEAELHPYVAALPDYRRFVDIGCAEGYYAVGAARLAPAIEVFAFDTDPRARAKCLALADVNGVAARVTLGEFCSAATLANLAAPETLVLIDIEGAEVDLLEALPADRRALCDFLVETHHKPEGAPNVGRLADLLSGTHDVTVVDQQPRDWRPFPVLMHFGQFDRFLAQWEGRGPDPWIFARARRQAS